MIDKLTSILKSNIVTKKMSNVLASSGAYVC